MQFHLFSINSYYPIVQFALFTDVQAGIHFQPLPEKVPLVEWWRELSIVFANERAGFNTGEFFLGLLLSSWTDPGISSEAGMTVCSGFPPLCMASCGFSKGCRMAGSSYRFVWSGRGVNSSLNL